MAFGVTPAGLVIKTLQDVKTEMETDLRSTFGPGANLEPQSNIGQLVGIYCDGFANMWQLLEAVYSSATPDGASGKQLDDLLAITGTIRRPATRTKVLVSVTGDAGTLLPAGRIIRTTAGFDFQTVADVTIDISGTSINVECLAVNTGIVPAYAGTLTSIQTPVSGWASVTNPADHYFLGSAVESDASVRVRREVELRASGNAANEAIRQHLLKVPGVTQALVFENETDTTDVNGLPPHSIECLVQGGTDAAVAAAVLASKAAGIATFGSSTQTPTDTSGTARTINFSRPTLKTVWIIANLTTDASYPGDGAAQVKDALVAYGADHLKVGDDVIQKALLAQVFKVSGVDDVTSFLIGFTNPPTLGNNLTIGVRELAVFDTSRITVTP